MSCNPGAESSPTNGTEPGWNPERWQANEKYNNCYSYALDDHNGDSQVRNHKPTPGNTTGFYTCSKILEGLKTDQPRLYPITFDCPCDQGYKKIYAAVSTEDEEGDNDFHFWRQDQDGWWSHKPGSNQPSRVDGSNQAIRNPEQSNRVIGSRAYVQGCGFFCVPDPSRSI